MLHNKQFLVERYLFIYKSPSGGFRGHYYIFHLIYMEKLYNQSKTQASNKKIIKKIFRDL